MQLGQASRDAKSVVVSCRSENEIIRMDFVCLQQIKGTFQSEKYFYHHNFRNDSLICDN